MEGIFSLEDRNVKMHKNQENLTLHGLILQLSRSEGKMKYKSMMTIIMYAILLRKGGCLLIEEWIFRPKE